MRLLFVIVLCGLGLQTAAQGPEDRAQDVLNFISGEPGKERDWDKFRSYFTENAQFAAVGTDPKGETVVQSFDLEGFISKVGPGYANGFLEEAVKTFSTEFNGIATIWQQFKAQAGTTVFEGINTLQLVKVNDQWKISSLLWTVAAPGQSIPGSPFDCP